MYNCNIMAYFSDTATAANKLHHTTAVTIAAKKNKISMPAASLNSIFFKKQCLYSINSISNVTIG